MAAFRYLVAASALSVSQIWAIGKRQFRTVAQIAEIRPNFADPLSQDCRFQAIAAIEIVPMLMLPAGRTAMGHGPASWRKMWGYFMYRQDEFQAHYHLRSNVESVFSAVKRKFGGAVRSKKCLLFSSAFPLADGTRDSLRPSPLSGPQQLLPAPSIESLPGMSEGGSGYGSERLTGSNTH
jgi:hypothetical protein